MKMNVKHKVEHQADGSRSTPEEWVGNDLFRPSLDEITSGAIDDLRKELKSIRDREKSTKKNEGMFDAQA
jgi:hypothetical protein